MLQSTAKKRKDKCYVIPGKIVFYSFKELHCVTWLTSVKLVNEYY